MFLFDMPPPPFSDIPSSAAGFGFFLFFMAIAVFSFIQFKGRSLVFRLITATILFVVAMIGSFIVSFIVAQITYQRPHPPGPPYSNSR